MKLTGKASLALKVSEAFFVSVRKQHCPFTRFSLGQNSVHVKRDLSPPKKDSFFNRLNN